MPNATSSNALPLCYSFRNTFFGSGYIAHVDMCGRMLAVTETDGVWIYGVNPGAIAVGAPTLDDASRELRDRLSMVFIDFAAESKTLDAFATCVREFFDADDQRDEWDAAVEAIKNGTVRAPADIARQPNPHIYVRVEEVPVENVTPDDNQVAARERPQVLAMAA